MCSKLCYWTIYPNGHQRAFIDALRAAGADVVVCYFGQYDRYRIEQGWSEPETLPSGEYRVKSLREARRLIPDYSRRLIILTGIYNRVYWQNLLHLIRNRQPWVHYSEGTNGRLRSALHRRIYGRCVDRYARHAFAIGYNARRDFIQNWGIAPEKITYLPYTTPDLPPTHAEKNYTYAYCGSLIPRKGIDTLAQAFRRVREQNPAANLLIIGDGPLRHLLQQPGITLTGALPPDRIPYYLAQAQTCILPSRFDGWGMVLAEAARENLALIATTTCGAAHHLIHPGENGHIIPPGDPDALATAMLTPLSGQHSRQIAAHTFPHAVATEFLKTVGATFK